MPTSKSPASYADVREALDKALEAPNGIRVRSTEPSQLRQRIYSFRKMDREASRHTYPEGDHRHGISIYDTLNVKVDETPGLEGVIIKVPAPLEVEEL